MHLLEWAGSSKFEDGEHHDNGHDGSGKSSRGAQAEVYRTLPSGRRTMKTGYMIRLIAGTQVIVGVLLLANRFVPLALALIAPVVVNIIAFHIFLSSIGIPLAVLVLVLEIYLAWAYRSVYRSMLAMRATPGLQ